MLEWIQRARRLSRGSLFAVLALYLAPSVTQAQDVNNCEPSLYLDRTAPDADRELTWDYTIFNDPERCIQVYAGQTVVFQSGDNFSFHPLAGGGGGDLPNPISQHDANGAVTFPTAGTFGFICLAHGPMRGAIRVLAPPSPVPLPAWLGAVLAPILLGAVALRLRSRRLDRSSA